MHSQQTFNECIAQAEGALAGQGHRLTGWALEEREQRLRPHVFISQLNGSVSTYFPAADSQEELQNIALLLLLKLLDVCSVKSSVVCSEESVGAGPGQWLRSWDVHLRAPMVAVNSQEQKVSELSPTAI